MRHPTKHLRLFLASVLAAGLLAGPAAFSGTAYAQAANGGPAAEKARVVGKVGFALTALSNEYHAFVNERGSDAGFVASNSLLPVVGGKVVIDAAANGDARALERALQALGLQNSAVAGRLVSGRLPFGSIRAAGALAGLRFARPAYAATRVGLVTSEADYVMNSDVARLSPPSGFGVDGAGQTVGVLSDSYDRYASALTHAADDIDNDDLPLETSIDILDDPACSGCIDEGRAMMQLVHDIAPGADLSFHTAFSGQADFAQGIRELAAAGAGIIVDDVIYFAEPMFQDGEIAKAVDDVVADGVAYFSAAGNDGRDGYEKVFAPGDTFAAREFRSARLAPRFFGGVAHDFDPGDGVANDQSITIPAGRMVIFSVQWQQPFFSACVGCPGATTDMDVYLLNSDDKVVAAGLSNNLGGDPVEVLGVINNGNTPAVMKLMIVKFDGTHPDPGMIKYVAFGGPTIDPLFDTASGTVYGHAAALGAEAVGAAFYQTPLVLESFSSAGPVRILFDENGISKPEETRYKPEIVAPDGTNTTFFYSDIVGDDDSFPNFFGTSAAAPHAAGVAALLRDRNGSLTPTDIYTALEDSAIDIRDRDGEPPNSLGVDFDDDSGHGLIQADVALGLVAPGNPDPVANNDGAPVNESASVVVDVLANDTSTGGVLTITAVSSAANGEASITGTNVTYTHYGSETLSDSFTYNIMDELGGTATATVTITVTPVNDPPVAVTDSAQVAEGASVNIDVLANDSDPDSSLTITGVTQGSIGGVTIDGATVTYTSTGGTGADSFTYTISDGEWSDTATVNVTVTGGGGGGGNMHIGGLGDGGSEISGRRLNKWTAMVTISVHGALEALIEGATASGTWSDGAKGGGSCTTDGSGQCTVTKNGLKLTAPSATFTVTDVTHASLAYVSADNHDPVGAEPAITVDQPPMP